MKIAVLLTCHNRSKKTENCLSSLGNALLYYNKNYEGGERVNLEIFLVDDGCTDGTVDAVTSIVDYARLHILKGDGNLYWAGGMRYCWREAMKRHAEWNYYLLINDDTEMMNNMFEELFNAERYTLEHYGKEGIVSGITCATDDPMRLTYGGDIIVNRLLSTKRRLYPNGKPQLCDKTNANILLVPTSVVDKIGIFFDGYQHGIADSDYSQMARRKGISVVLTAHFCGKCDKDQTDARVSAEKIINLSFKERKAYFRHPLHSTHDYLTAVRRNAPLRLPMVWVGRVLNLYLPKIYYKINGLR